MLDEDFEVHGAHDHAREHGVRTKPALGQQVAIFTAVLATIGAVVSFLGGYTQNEALYHKNEAVLKKAEASDQWSYYQAKSTKEAMAMFAAGISSDPKQREAYTQEAARYAREKEEIKQAAEGFEKQSAAANERSVHALHPHEKLAAAVTFLQIAIALASVTALTHRPWLLFCAAGAALMGCGLGVLAYLI
jgi:hypothetical protein